MSIRVNFFRLSKSVAVLSICFSLALIGGGFTGEASAAGITKEAKEKRKKNKAPLIRKKTYDRLMLAQELVEAQKYNEALAVLKKIEGMKRLNNTETSQLWNFYAYIYFSEENYPKAITAYKKLLQQPDLQPGLRGSTLYTLSQLYFVTEDYKKALSTVKEWMAITDDPGPDAYALLGQAYYKLEQYKEAIPPLKKAVALQKERGKPVKENWYLLLRVNYYELKDYKNMAVVLRQLVSLYPKKQYLQDLAGAYSQMGDTKKQLGIMEAMYETGYVTSESQLKNLASLFIMHGVPYKAAKVLKKGIDEGNVRETEKILSLLSQSWMQSREDKKAIPPLRKATALSSGGELWIRLGQAYANVDQWNAAVKALRTGLNKGGLKRTGAANILLGMSYYNMKMLNKAKTAFAAASRTGNQKNKKAAGQWITYIDTELERMESLAQR
jgi:tetratricopeptide (TPR) repeat protein